jgi:hypothetical protein
MCLSVKPGAAGGMHQVHPGKYTRGYGLEGRKNMHENEEKEQQNGNNINDVAAGHINVNDDDGGHNIDIPVAEMHGNVKDSRIIDADLDDDDDEDDDDDDEDKDVLNNVKPVNRLFQPHPLARPAGRA